VVLQAAHSGTHIILFEGRVAPAYARGEYRIFAALAAPARPRSPDDDAFLAADVRAIYVVP
jgi:hypothetical protein